MNRILQKTIVYFLTLIFYFLTAAQSAAAKPFFSADTGLPGIVVCEVNGYGENPIRQELYFSLRDLLLDQLYSSGKCRVEPRLTIEPVLANGEKVNLDQFFSQIHMDAISHSAHFEKSEANPSLRDYSASIPKTNSGSDVYFISGNLREKVREIGAAHQVKYLLFCNLRNVELEGSEGIDLPNFHLSPGFKLNIKLDYYLINSETGKVFEGRETASKSSQSLSIGGLNIGHEMTVEAMFHKVLYKMAKKIREYHYKKRHEGCRIIYMKEG